MLKAALELASAGWEVFPCQWEGDRAKAPLTARGFHDATLDPDQIRAWWDRWPNAMIGAPVPVGLVVLDLDPYHGGTLEALEAATGPLPATVTTWSGRRDGGRHLFYEIPWNMCPVGTRLPAGVDLRAGGKAYTIVAPSLHPLTGKPYRWEGTEFAVLPEQARQALLPPPPPPRPPRAATARCADGLVRAVAESTPGNRNAALFWAACRAAESGLLPVLATDLAAAARSVGLTDAEIQRTMSSAERTAGAGS